MRHAIRVAAVLLILGAPLGLAAQSTDSLPFRAGQWGAEFSASQSFGSAGLLRFRSNRSAWLLDVSASIRSGTRTGNLTTTDRSSVDLRVGPRWYRPIGARLLQFASVGPSVSYLSEESNAGSVQQVYQLDQHSTAFGLFGELGAAWLVTPQLSLGAAWQARAGYARVTTDQSVQGFDGHGKASQTFADLGTVTLRVSLYF